jgi:hypothetical protein
LAHYNQDYSKLLEDPNVKRWENNLSKGSIIVADIYLRRLGSFCRELSPFTPASFAALPVQKMEDVTQDFIDSFEQRKNPRNGRPYAPSYVGSYLKSIKSWADWNRKPLQ